MLLMIAMFFGCSKDESSSSCTPIACLNGGVSTADCGCNCPQGYTGSNCGTQVTPTTIKITKIRVKKFPDTDNGSWWDVLPNSDADIYVTLVNTSFQTIYTSGYYTDATGLGTIYYDFTPTTPITITNVTSALSIKLYDRDYDILSLTYTGSLMDSLFFNPYSSTGGFPPTITRTNDSGKLECEISLQYVW